MIKKTIYSIIVLLVMMEGLVHASSSGPNQGNTQEDDVYAVFLDMQAQGVVFKPKPLAWWQVAGVKIGVPFYKTCVVPIKKTMGCLRSLVIRKLWRN